MGIFRKLVLIFTIVPVVEFIIFWQLGKLISIELTIAIIIITGFIGAWLTKAQGLKTLQKYQAALASGQLPHREMIDGILILLSGAVLLTPGFLTDAVGFSLLVPWVRDRVRGVLAEKLKGKVHMMGPGGPVSGDPGTSRPRSGSGRSSAGGDVITVESEVIDE